MGARTLETDCSLEKIEPEEQQLAACGAKDCMQKAPLDGSWSDTKTMAHKAIIDGNHIIWPAVGGQDQKTVELLKRTSTSLVLKTKRGKRGEIIEITAVVKEDGSLHWDDGDIWTRASQAKTLET